MELLIGGIVLVLLAGVLAIAQVVVTRLMVSLTGVEDDEALTTVLTSTF